MEQESIHIMGTARIGIKSTLGMGSTMAMESTMGMEFTMRSSQPLGLLGLIEQKKTSEGKREGEKNSLIGY